MYIYGIDYANEVIIRSDNYPKIHYLFVKDAITGLLEHDKVKVIELKPVSGRKITITVAENGYIVSANAKTHHIVELGAFGKSLYETVNDLLMEEVISHRDYTEDELNDEDLIRALDDLNLKAIRI